MFRALSLIALLWAMSANATTHRVSPGESIQAVIAAAGEGDTIELVAGTWRENLVIEKSLRLVGQGALLTNVQLPGYTEPTIEAELEKLLRRLADLPVEQRPMFWRTNREFVSPPPLQIAGPHQVELRGIGFRWRGPLTKDPSVIRNLADIREADVVMEDVALLGSSADALLVHDRAALVMRDCLIAGSLGRGVMIGAKDEPVRRAHFLRCEVRHNYLSHLAMVYNARDVRIEDCLLHGSAFFGIRAYATNAVITGNHFHDIPRAGLYCASPTALTVSNNLFVTAGAASFWKAGHDRFVNNTVIARDRSGLLAIDDADPLIADNVFHGCGTAVQGSYSPAAKPGDASGRFELRGNWYSDNGTNGVRYFGARDPEIVPPASGARFGDPGFVAAESGDFRLRSDSPARLAGMGARLDRRPASRFPLQPEEAAIIPATNSWDFSQWRLPQKPDLQHFNERIYALLKPPSEPTVSYADAFKELYETLGRSYPNFELKQIDWPAVGRELSPRAKTVANDREFAWLCYELAARLKDSHVFFSKGSISPPPVPFPQWDPGFACLEDEQGRPVVYHVDPDGPAAQAGLAVGSVVLQIDGRSTEDVIRAVMSGLSRFQGYSSERYLRYHAMRFFHRRERKGIDVKLRVLAPGGHERELTLPAEMAARYLPRRPVPTPGVQDSANVSWTRVTDDVGLIYVRRIRNDLIPQLDQAVAELKDVKGLIVDVRGNSGGGFDAGRAFVNFTDIRERDPDRPRFTGPMALLIDERCISAGEGWASWFIARNRARTFGTATAGASARKTTYELKNGLLKITFPVKPYRGFLDRIIEVRGLEPDVPLRQTAADLAAGRDTVCEAAIAWLRKQ